MAQRRPVYRLITLALTIGTLLLGLVGTSSAAPSAASTMLLATVPNVVGLDSGTAIDTLNAAGYAVDIKTKTVTHGDCSRDDTVSAQSPRGGTVLAPGGTVTITVLAFLNCF